jgi:biotin transport system substrate-specific component
MTFQVISQSAMIQDQAFLPRLLAKSRHTIFHNALSILGGALLLSLLAQVAIPLPWTPVPITGQTFGVAFTSLLWGRKRGLAVTLLYVTGGAAGLPIFAGGQSGLIMGPTVGYLAGMILASFLMGLLADLGWTKTWLRTWLAASSGSLVTFLCGVLGLSFFLPTEQLFVAGVLPFLPGDLLKTLLASTLVFQTHSRMEDPL